MTDVRHQWLGSATRRTLFVVHPRGATCLGWVTTDPPREERWGAYTAHGRLVGKRATRDEAGRVLCEHLGIEMPGFDSGDDPEALT